jgi:chromosome segregation ATPase
MTTISQKDTGENKPRRQRASTGRSKKSPGAEITTPQAQLKEKEEVLQANDAAFRQLEESLVARARDLENQVRERDELLLGREAELKKLRSEAAAALRQLEENLAGRIRDLENQVREKDELLLSREAESKMLRSEADAVMEEMAQVRKDRDQIFMETVKLTSELKEKKLALAQLEKDEWRSIGKRNSLKRRFGKLRKLFSKTDDDEQDPKMKDRFPLTSR